MGNTMNSSVYCPCLESGVRFTCRQRLRGGPGLIGQIGVTTLVDLTISQYCGLVVIGEWVVMMEVVVSQHRAT